MISIHWHTWVDSRKTCDKFFPKENHTSGLRSFNISVQAPITIIIYFLNYLCGMWTSRNGNGLGSGWVSYTQTYRI